ncbi:MAG: helix-turn-helix domain-containing protein [bacterium]
MEITFDNLPQQVSKLNERLDRIETLLSKQVNTTQEPEDQFLTIEEAAEFLKLAPTTMYGLVQRGSIPSMKRSKRLYFSKKELIEYLKKGRKKSMHDIEAEANEYLNK